MIEARTDGLLLELLNRQTDSGEGSLLSEARIEQALTTGPAFSDEERRLFWRAPLARESLFRVKKRLCRGVLEHWESAGIEPVAALRAAADDADDVVKVHGDGFTLTIFPEADVTMPWILSLQIDDALRADMPAGLRFQLIDSGGKVWLTGRPNSRGRDQ